MALAERLRKDWRERANEAVLDAEMRFVGGDLVLGAGTVLVPREAPNVADVSSEMRPRLEVLLAAAYDGPIRGGALNHVLKAAARWREGQESLAGIHLALSGLGEIALPRQGAKRPFLTEGLLRAGCSPERLMKVLDLPTTEDFTKYDPDQPRTPPGNGRASGQWTDGSATVEPSMPGSDAPHASSSSAPEPGVNRRDDSGDFEHRLLAALEGIAPAETKVQITRTAEVNSSTVTPAASGDLAQAIIEANAQANIRAALRDPRTSPTARAVLSSFLTGEEPRHFVFGAGSPGLSELFADDPTGYVRGEVRGVIAYTLAKYHTAYLEDGYVVTAYTKRSFSPYDAVIGLKDGIQIGDVVGTMSSGWNLSIEGGQMHFSATNATTLTSYAAGNLLSHAGLGSLVVDPKSGPLSPVTQTFEFSMPIPKYLRRPAK